MEGKNLAKRYAAIRFIQTLIVMFTTTFLILYVIDRVGLAAVGILAALMLITQGLLDYPLGVLSDSIGQRWVISLAWLMVVLVDISLIFAETFYDFIPIYIILGITFALFSGAYETWLDNNYKAVVSEEDPDRKIYGFLFSRVNSLTQLASVFAIIFGGLLATFYSREIAFLIQAILGFFFAIALLFFLKDYYKKDLEKKPISIYLKNYIITSKSGISFLFSSKRVFFFLFGIIIFQSIIFIWSSLILFVIYFGYTGSDALAGGVRTIGFLVDILIGLYSAKISIKLSSSSWIHRLYFVFFLLFFGGFAILFWLIPMTDQFNLFANIWVIIILEVPLFFLFIVLILQQRTIIDLVPEKIRNSVYSLIPTLAALFSFPLMILMGFILEQINFSTGMILLLLLGMISTLAFYLADKNPQESEEQSKKNAF